jgi:hypothetical protein
MEGGSGDPSWYISRQYYAECSRRESLSEIALVPRYIGKLSCRHDLFEGRSKIPFFGTTFLPTIIDGQWKKRFRKFCRLHIKKSSYLITYHRRCLLFRQTIAIPLDLPVPASRLSLKNAQLVHKYSRCNKNQSGDVGRCHNLLRKAISSIAPERGIKRSFISIKTPVNHRS